MDAWRLVVYLTNFNTLDDIQLALDRVKEEIERATGGDTGFDGVHDFDYDVEFGDGKIDIRLSFETEEEA